MWNTPIGIRQLAPKERALFGAGLTSLLGRCIHEYRVDSSRELRVPVLDIMEPRLRRYVVGVGVSGLRCTTPEPPRTQWREASALAVFRHVEAELHDEVMETSSTRYPGPPRETTWRELVSHAWSELRHSAAKPTTPPGTPWPSQPSTSEIVGEWSIMIESLIDQVLWNRNCVLHCEKTEKQCGGRRRGVPLDSAWIPSHAVKHATNERPHTKYFASPPPISVLKQQILQANSA